MPDQTANTPEFDQNDQSNAGSPPDASAKDGSSPVANGHPDADAAADADLSAAQPTAPAPDGEPAPASDDVTAADADAAAPDTQATPESEPIGAADLDSSAATGASPPGEEATGQAQPDAPQTSDEGASASSSDQDKAEALPNETRAPAGLADAHATTIEPGSETVDSDQGTAEAAEADGDEGEVLLSQEDLNSLLGVAAEAKPDKKAKLAVDAVSEANQESGEQESESPAGSMSPPPPSESPQNAAAPLEQDAALAAMLADAQPIDMPQLSSSEAPSEPRSTIDLLDDVELDVKIELGRTEMYVEDVLRLGVGSVVELDKLAGDPVDILINQRLVGRGEVLVLNDNFCVRINEILSPVPEKETSS